MRTVTGAKVGNYTGSSSSFYLFTDVVIYHPSVHGLSISIPGTLEAFHMNADFTKLRREAAKGSSTYHSVPEYAITMTARKVT